ncbi:Os01g0387133, partial [Oryza sativa Japonica Group]
GESRTILRLHPSISSQLAPSLPLGFFIHHPPQLQPCEHGEQGASEHDCSDGDHRLGAASGDLGWRRGWHRNKDQIPSTSKPAA